MGRNNFSHKVVEHFDFDFQCLHKIWLIHLFKASSLNNNMFMDHVKTNSEKKNHFKTSNFISVNSGDSHYKYKYSSAFKALGQEK